MDIVYLRHLTVDTVIGVWEWERRIRQTLIMDLELGVDTVAAAASDDLTYTVDYKAVSDRKTTLDNRARSENSSIFSVSETGLPRRTACAYDAAAFF